MREREKREGTLKSGILCRASYIHIMLLEMYPINQHGENVHLSNNLRNMNQNNCIPTTKYTRNNDRTILLAEMSGTSVLAITGSTVSAPASLQPACCYGTRAIKPLILNSSLSYTPKGILKRKRETERKQSNKVSNSILLKSKIKPV